VRPQPISEQIRYLEREKFQFEWCFDLMLPTVKMVIDLSAVYRAKRQQIHYYADRLTR